jgi:hypothetical protein
MAVLLGRHVPRRDPEYAETGIAVFRIAFERWVNEPDRRDMPELIRESLDELRAVTAGRVLL